MEESKTNHSLSELFGELSHEFRKLARQEFEYAQVEFTEKITRISKDALFVGIGGSLAYAGLLCLIAAAVCALALVVSWWLAAFIVAAITIFFGLLLLSLGIYRLRKRRLVPTRTIEHLKEDKEWLTKQIT